MSNIQLVEVTPKQPFVGSYVCPIEVADLVRDTLKTDDRGYAIKAVEGRKKYRGLVPVRRRLTLRELQRAASGEALPANIEVDPASKAALAAYKPSHTSVPDIWAIEHPAERTVKVPSDIAESLVERGLAEFVKRK